MQSRLARALPALALIVAALGASCSKSSDSTSPAPPVTGPTFNFGFTTAGTVASPGTSNKFIFNDVGSWTYHCIPHQGAGMVGTVNVVASGAPEDSQVVRVGVDDTPAHNPAFRYSPPTVTINVGGYVRWVNASSMTIHTVTR